MSAKIGRNQMISFVAVFALLAMLLAKQFQQPSAVNPQTPRAQSPVIQGPSAQAQEGVVDINTYEWKGILCSEPHMRMTATILTKGVWWQARLDRDDSRIIDLSPKDSGGKTCDITDPFHVLEWRIKSGQSITVGSVFYTIKPDTNNVSQN